jgi:DNA processing protein
MNLIYYYWLATIDGVGPKRARDIIEYFGSPSEAWQGTYEDFIKIRGLNTQLLEKIIERRDKDRLQKELSCIRSRDIIIVTIDDDEYPENLKSIYDPPLILYCRGKMVKCKKYLAVVGSRKCTSYGKVIARSISKLLAECGIGVISGLARGIDTEAHIGALEGGGFTCAVLGCGCDVVYPPENKKVMAEIMQRGLIISEYPPGTKPYSFNFPARNRIISGISDGVLVIEAGERSGALITTDFGLEQGKDIFAVPGSILSSLSRGTNMLIRDGAKIVTCIEDILSELGLEVETRKTDANTEGLSSGEKVLMDIISNSPIYVDDLIQRVSLKISDINSIITTLELKGIIKVLPGKYIVRVI